MTPEEIIVSVEKTEAERRANRNAREAARAKVLRAKEPAWKRKERLADAALRMRVKRAANPDKYRTYQKEWRDKNPDKTKGHKRKEYNKNRESYQSYRLRKAFGITSEQKKDMLTKQGDCCGICKSLSPGGKYWHTDHCHVTKRIRGVLCHHCNLLLANAKDNPDTLLAAVAYLAR